MSLVVPATVAVVVGTTELARVSAHKGPTFRPLVAGFIVGLGLYGLQGLNEQLGTLFAVLIILTALLRNSDPLLKWVNRVITPSK